MERRVSVIIPVIRPANVEQLERWILDRAGIPSSDVEIITMEDKERIGAPRMIKMLTQMSRHKYVMFLGDDCEPQENFILHAFKEMSKFKGNWGLVGLNCGRWVDDNIVGCSGPDSLGWQSFLNHGEVSQHWMAHKEILKHLDGEFFHTGYTHCFCDNELTTRCKDLKRYRFSKKSKIVHYHPIVQQDDDLWDDDYKRVYSDDVYLADKKLFELRRANGWKTPQKTKSQNEQVVILVPVYGQGKHKFWTNLSRMQFECLGAGIETAVRKKSSTDIAHCRNMLVSENLKRFPDTEWFLFMDTDHTFPDDMLIRLLAHRKDIVTTSAYRKGGAHYPVVSMQGDADDYFRPLHIKPEDGKLRRITSAGTGIVLVHRRVFEGIKFPWFKSEYIDPVAEDMEAETLIEGKMFVSEDNRFYVIATSLGFKLYCDFSIEIGHIGDYNYTWRDHERYIKEHPEAVEVIKDGKRNESHDENPYSGNGWNRDQQHDQPGIEGRV